MYFIMTSKSECFKAKIIKGMPGSRITIPAHLMKLMDLKTGDFVSVQVSKLE